VVPAHLRLSGFHDVAQRDVGEEVLPQVEVVRVLRVPRDHGHVEPGQHGSVGLPELVVLLQHALLARIFQQSQPIQCLHGR
jgi:hypothetical protein